ncbi:MAG: phage portal protein [Nitrospirae bacterium]|nr:phage portal protein [Nitrospirota bacterium]
MNFLDRIRQFMTKQSAVTRAIVLLWDGNPVWTPRNFGDLAKEGFEANVTVYACVMEIARSAAGIPWLLYRKGRGKRQIEIEEHPLLTLLRRPNPWQGQSAFFEAATAFLMLSGNSYIERVGPQRGLPRELYTLRPDRVKVLPDIKNMIAGYRYEVGGQKQDFERETVLHMKLFSALDDWYGLSPIAVAGRTVDSDNEALKWNYALLKNSARPPGGLSTAGNLTSDQFDKLKRQIEEKFVGPDNAGRPLLLEAGLDWKSFAISPADMDWLEGRKMSRIEICNVFQVPPELIGIQDQKTYSNYQEARKAFYTETVLPLMDRLRDDLNNWLVPVFGDNMTLEYDKDEIEALQEDRGKVWTRVQNANWLTVNEKRAATGYEEVDGGDVVLVPATLVPLQGAIQLPQGDPNLANPQNATY